jgi:hypothetical protein
MTDPFVPVDDVLCSASVHLPCHSDGAGEAIEFGAGVGGHRFGFLWACLRRVDV